MVTQAEANLLKFLADQWASHSALAAVSDGMKRRYRNQRRDEMKARFLKELQSLTEKSDAD